MSAGLKTKDITAIPFSAALMCICSWISIPGPVPFTLQTFAVFLSLGLFGGRRGCISVLLYIFLGCTGLPVFSGFSGGIGVFLGPTGGYIIGFLFSSLSVWLIFYLFGDKMYIRILAMFLGLAACYVSAILWLMTFYIKNVSVLSFTIAFTKYVLPFIFPDILKIFLSILITDKLKRYLK